MFVISFVPLCLAWKEYGVRLWLTSGLIALAYSYFVGLFAWALLRYLFGDRWWWLFLLSSLAAYLFAPLCLIPFVAFATRRSDLWVGSGLGFILWATLYGALFFPGTGFVQAAQPDSAALTIMSYNMLRHNHASEYVLAAIQSADADVVTLQELNVSTAEAIRHKLSAIYPYQILVPGVDSPGMGVLSRYPLYDTGETLPGRWIGIPQILTLDFIGTQITLFNIHAISTSMGYGGNLRIEPEKMEASIWEREQQIHILMDAVAAHHNPVIVTGDFNTGDQSEAYAIVTRRLKDAWREAGWGLGHTFPGADIPGSSRPAIGGIRIPKWLIRIDYIFHSDDWHAINAQIGPWDGRSDHRPVIAELVLSS